MNPILRNILAVIVGIIGGALVNMAIIMISGAVIPPPDGVDTNDLESIKANIHLYQPIHFIFPFLAHALGSLIGSLIAASLVTTRRMTFAVAMGFWFLIGGLAAAYWIPAPNWFIALDLLVAYVPMGWLGGKLATRS